MSILFVIFVIIATSLQFIINNHPHVGIVGGKNTTIDKHPYQVSLRVWGRHNCGGCILNKYYVLTAAHCLYGYKVSSITIRVGSTRVDRGGFIKKIAEFFIYEKYNKSTMYDYDIGIIKVRFPFWFTNNIRPAKLPKQNERNDSVDSEIGMATGWGRLYEDGPLPGQLQMIEIPTWLQIVCKWAYAEYNITDRMFCAGFYKTGKGTCESDYGGPLIVDGVVIGISSWSRGCGREKSPTVYTRVSYFVDYINSIVAR